ncbi:MAG: hypothetical protein K6F80_05505 [Oscillospiraceae bacterium]|nr:hypothetical protein [Oscillospiraceae bacterium]
MSSTVFIVCLMLAGLGGAVLIVLLTGSNAEEKPHCGAFALLPVTEDSPSERAFLEYYASQIMWMDADILQCVILVCTPESEELCQEMTRNYTCYRMMALQEVQEHIAAQFREKYGKSG